LTYLSRNLDSIKHSVEPLQNGVEHTVSEIIIHYSRPSCVTA